MIQLILLIVGLIPIGPGSRGHDGSSSDGVDLQDTRRRRQYYITIPEKPPEKPREMPIAAQGQ